MYWRDMKNAPIFLYVLSMMQNQLTSYQWHAQILIGMLMKKCIKLWYRTCIEYSVPSSSYHLLLQHEYEMCVYISDQLCGQYIIDRWVHNRKWRCSIMFWSIIVVLINSVITRSGIRWNWFLLINSRYLRLRCRVTRFNLDKLREVRP